MKLKNIEAEEDTEMEYWGEQINDLGKKLPHLINVIDDLQCDLSEYESERDEIYEEIKECKIEYNKIKDKKEERDFQKYFKIPWYKCLITPGQSLLEI